MIIHINVIKTYVKENYQVIKFIKTNAEEFSPLICFLTINFCVK